MRAGGVSSGTTDPAVPLDVLESIEAADGSAADGTEDPRAEGAAGVAGPGGSALEARYRSYCRQQAAALLTLLPRDAIRPLHREALSWAAAGGYLHDTSEPLETLVAYCTRLLPLPPFDAWREDIRQNPLAHAEAAIFTPGAGTAASRPVTLAARTVERAGETWDAGLRVFAEGGAWRGYVVFRCRATHRRARTARIFREDGPRAVRERFTEMAPATLAAFLRSSLP